MPDPIISRSEPADPSAPAADFAHASPFRRQREESDPVRKGILIGLVIVLLVFLGSMIAVLMMHAPAL